MELGIYTFGDLVLDPRTGRAVSAEERTHAMIAAAKLADERGLDVVGVGEHHGLGYVNSATAVLLSAMAAVTKRVRLTSASTSISTADPVRTFQEFATADLVSRGRVEVILGRGAFTDNFALFWYRLDDYDALFTEKVELFQQLAASERVTWTGRFRPALHEAEIAPRPAQARMPVWIGALSPRSVVRAAALGLPLAMPMLGGRLSGYAQLAKLYRQSWAEHGRAPADARIAVFAHLHVTRTSEETRRDFFANYAAYLAPIFKGGMPPEAFAEMLGPQGTLVGGSVAEVVDKLGAIRDALGATRFVGQIDIGGQDASAVLDGIARFADEVAPALRR